MTNPRCILTVHAHPDDESSKGPGTIARYGAQGTRTVLVCCTDGAEGDILNPAMDTDEVKADLAAVRARELDEAAAIIGYHQVHRLGYRDSGMADSPANSHPECFAQAELDAATERLVAILRAERPQVVITYPERQEQYPHPDHLKVYDVSAAAFEAAGDPERFPDAGAPFQPQKLYAVVWPVQRARAMHAKFLELGLESPYDAEWLARIDAFVDTSTAKISIEGHGHVRDLALKAHATQIDPTSTWWFGLSPEVSASLHPYEHYQLLRSRVEVTPGIEDDLFAGIS